MGNTAADSPPIVIAYVHPLITPSPRTNNIHQLFIQASKVLDCIKSSIQRERHIFLVYIQSISLLTLLYIIYTIKRK